MDQPYGSVAQARSIKNPRGSDPYAQIELQKYDEEKMLIEQDPFLLEEQRYLNRMQRAHNVQEKTYKKHYDEVTIQMEQKRKQQEDYENQVIERRLNSLAEAQERQRRMKTDLTKIHTQAIQR